MSELSYEILQFFKQQASLYPNDFYLQPEVEEEIQQDQTEQPKPIVPEIAVSSDEEFISSGNPKAKLLFVCTRPLKEDFINRNLISGEAGKLFDKIIKAIDLSREDVYIISLRSVSNAGKLSDDSKLDRFDQLVDEMKPTLIVSLGENAGNEILKTEYQLDDVHGKLYEYKDAKFMFTFHPELVRLNQKLKRPVWEDFKLIREAVKS